MYGSCPQLIFCVGPAKDKCVEGSQPTILHGWPAVSCWGGVAETIELVQRRSDRCMKGGRVVCGLWCFDTNCPAVLGTRKYYKIRYRDVEWSQMTRDGHMTSQAGLAHSRQVWASVQGALECLYESYPELIFRVGPARKDTRRAAEPKITTTSVILRGCPVGMKPERQSRWFKSSWATT